MTSCVGKGGQLSNDSKRGEFYPVITCTRLLVFMGERKRLDSETILILRHFPDNRHKEEIPKISLAGTTEVCMGETEDQAVFIMVAGHSSIHSVRAQLYKAERNRCGRTGMAVQSRSDEGVDLCRGSL